MYWFDLGLSGAFLWGGISGYLAGWKVSARHLTALAATMATAAAFKGDVRLFISLHHPVGDAIKALILNRIAMPVGGGRPPQSASIEAIGLPELLQDAIIEKISSAAEPYNYAVVESLTTIMMNALAFCSAIILWWGVFYLVAIYRSGNKQSPFKPYERWAGFIAGMIQQALLIVMITGATAPLVWLFSIPGEIFDPGQSIFLRWSLQLIRYTGVLWN